MTRRPDDFTPEPPGGRAAERLREFIDQRFPEGLPGGEGARDDVEDSAPDPEHEGDGEADGGHDPHGGEGDRAG